MKIKYKLILIDTLKKRRWQIIGHTLRHGDELHILITEGIIEGTRSRGRPRMKHISQIMKDAVVISYREINDMANDRKTWKGHLL